ncbi:unnamed protein product [Schistosoma turkestanicum]|nr:unnamed protein product [Schistosoma turkestanicum]
MLDVPIPNSLDQSYKSLSETFSEYKYSEDFDVSTLCDLFLESGPNQGCYIGEWVNDKIEGNGKVHFPSGSYYEGNFKDNKMDGIGTYYWPSGHILKAEFEQNNIREDSLIELIDPDGKQWTGRFKRHQHQQQQQQQQHNNDKVRNQNNNDSYQNNINRNNLTEEIASKSIFETEYISECQTKEEKEREDQINKLINEDNHLNQFENENVSSFIDSIFNSFNGKSTCNNKNFIKRNIELVSRWKDIIPMTDEDKARIEEILADDDDDDKMQIVKQNDTQQNEFHFNESSDLSLQNTASLPSIDNMPSILHLYSNATKQNGTYSILNNNNNDDNDHNAQNNQSDSVNQLMLKANHQHVVDSEILGILSRLNEIDKQLEQFQIQRKADSGNISEISSYLRSTEEENQILSDPIRPGEYALSTYQETRAVKERLIEIETQLAKIQKTSFEELSAILFLTCYTKLWSNSSSNIEQLTVDLNELTPND